MIKGSGKCSKTYLIRSDGGTWSMEQFWIEFIDLVIRVQKAPPRSSGRTIKWVEFFSRWTAEKGTSFPATTQKTLRCYFSTIVHKTMRETGANLLLKSRFVTTPIEEKMNQYLCLLQNSWEESFAEEQLLSRGGREEEEYTERTSIAPLDYTSLRKRDCHQLEKENIRFMEEQLYEVQICCDNLVATANRRARQILTSKGTIQVAKKARLSVTEDEDNVENKYNLHWALREFDGLKRKLTALLKERISVVSFNLKNDSQNSNKAYRQGNLNEMATDPIAVAASNIDEVIGRWPNIVPGFKAGINTSYHSMGDFDKAMGVVVACIRANQVHVVLGELVSRRAINFNELFTPESLYEVSQIMKTDNFQRAVTRRLKELKPKAQFDGGRESLGAAYATIFASAEAKQARHIKEVRARTSGELVQLERQLKRKREDVDREIRKVVELYKFVDDYIPMSQRDINKEAIKRYTNACQVHGIPVPNNIDDALLSSVRERYEKEIIQEHREQYVAKPEVAEKLKIFVAKELYHSQVNSGARGLRASWKQRAYKTDVTRTEPSDAGGGAGFSREISALRANNRIEEIIDRDPVAAGGS